jgi:hypothetical protein
MFRMFAALGIGALLLHGCAGQEKTVEVAPEVMETNTREARATVKAFFGELKGELVAAIKKGGPAHAVSVCNTEAAEIARRVSAQQGMDISRVSLKNRNPGNAATGWKKTILEQFEARKAAGEPPDSLEFASVVATADGNVFRYMKAIPTGEVCLNCHGTDIAAEVTAKLEKLYPEDKATGYRVGDLRGAFVVTKKM